MLDVIGFGALNLDLIYEVDSLNHISGEEGELRPGRELATDSESFVKIQNRVEKRGSLKAEAPGGSAANTISALARMGFRTGFVGKVGTDAEGETLLSGMTEIDLGGVIHGGRSGRCLSVLDGQRDRLMMLEPNTNDTLSIDEIDWHFAANTRYLHLTSFVGERPLLAQKALAERVSAQVRLTFDPGEVYVRRGLDILQSIIEKSYVVFATDGEIERLTGLDFVTGSVRLLEMGASIVACKRGEKGACVISHQDRITLPSKAVEVVDNTGAGDVFNAGFLAGLLMDWNLIECTQFGIELAARSLTGFGRNRYPSKSDLPSFIHRH